MTTDAELVDRVRRDDVEAFEVLVSRYERSVLALAMALLHDPAAAEDVSQEAFVRAYRSIRHLHQRSRFGPWLMKIARREALQVIRKRKRHVATIKSWARERDSRSAEGDGILDEQRREILGLILRLPAHERLVVSLRFLDGHAVAVIAEMTGRPVGTVTKQISRALKRLRSYNGYPET